MDLKQYNLELLNDSELYEYTGGGFWNGLLETILGAGEIIGGVSIFLFDKGRLLNEGVDDVIDGVDQMVA